MATKTATKYRKQRDEANQRADELVAAARSLMATALDKAMALSVAMEHGEPLSIQREMVAGVVDALTVDGVTPPYVNPGCDQNSDGPSGMQLCPNCDGSGLARVQS